MPSITGIGNLLLLLLTLEASARPFTSSPPLLTNSTFTTITAQLNGTSNVREHIFEDALELLLAASPTHSEYDRATKKMKTLDDWTVIDLVNDDISTYSDGSPIGPSTPPQELERRPARDFASLVRRSAPYMSAPLTRIDQHNSIWYLKWNPQVQKLHAALRQVVYYAFSRVYTETWALNTAMEIFDSFELGDLIMWINDSKERDGDETGRLSTQSSVDELWNKCHVQDLESLCDAIDQKALDWSRIPWPAEDELVRHRGDINWFRGGVLLQGGQGEGGGGGDVVEITS